MAGIFNINFRKLFGQALPPNIRFDQSLDLGESLLTTLKTDSDTLNTTDTLLQKEKKYSGVKMVLEASLNDIFSETTFEVETPREQIVRTRFLLTEEENEAVYLEKIGGDARPYHLFNEAESALDKSFIVSVPAALFTSSEDKVANEVKKLKVAGKSFKLVSL